MNTPVDFLLERMRAAGRKPALIDAGQVICYDALLAECHALETDFAEAGISRGVSVQLRGDFGTNGIASLIALLHLGAIVTPVAPSSLEKAPEFAHTADASFCVDATSDHLPSVTALAGQSAAPIFEPLRQAGHPGLIIFSSGTTGMAKGAVHDAARLLSKFETPGKDFITLAFLLFDHIAGLDTLFYGLANGSTLVMPGDRRPETVARLIEAHRVEVLPTAPSFLNLMLLSGTAETRDLSSLKIVTYGAETMPQTLLDRVAEVFPQARIIQKYGTSETGALRSRSENNTSLWLAIGVEEQDWRVRSGQLQIKARTNMLGYLNAPSPFTEDGWYRTGDRVETRDGLVRILGRDSDIINVGGQKVFPAEVENALRRIEGVAEAAVYGRPHPMLGAAVCARVRMDDTDMAAPAAIRSLLRQKLQGLLEPFKIPQRIEVTSETLTTARFKNQRGRVN